MNKALEKVQLKDTQPDNTLEVDQADPQQTSRVHGMRTVMRNSRFIQLLCALLAVQLLVAGFLAMRSDRGGEFTAGEPPFTIVADNIEKISITDGDEEVVLSKQSGDWAIDGEVSLPLQASRIEGLLETLSTMKTGLPVASTVNAREQLEVADDQFQRRISISGGESDSTTLLVGTSPGLRKSHVRRDGSDDIFSATLAVSDLPASVNQWLNKGLLSVAGVNSIQSADLSLKLEGEGDTAGWAIAEPADEQRGIDNVKIDAAVQALQNLQVSGVEMQPSDLQAETETTSIAVSGESGEVALTLIKNEQVYSLRRDDVPGVFTINESVYESLLPLANPESLLMVEEKSSDVEPSETETMDTDDARPEAVEPETPEREPPEAEGAAE